MLSALSEFRRELSPALATLEVLPRLVAVPPNEVAIPAVSLPEAPVRRDDRPMRPVAQKLLDLPDIFLGQSPVIGIEHPQIEHRIAFDPASVIHVTLGVAQRERTRSRKNRLTPVQPGIA